MPLSWLVGLGRDHGLDSPAPRRLARFATAVALVADAPTGSSARAAPADALDRTVIEEDLKLAQFVSLAPGQPHGDGLAAPFGAQVQFGAEAAPASAQCLLRTLPMSAAGASRMLVRADDAAVDKVRRPVELTGSVCLLVQGCQDLIPDPRVDPAIELGGHGTPGAVAIRHVAPGGARRVQPENPIEDAAPIPWAHSAFGSGKQWHQPRPLVIRYCVSGFILSVYT